MIDIYLIAAVLFFAQVITAKKNPLTNGAFFAVLLLFAATAFPLPYSAFSIVKSAFFLYLISLPFENEPSPSEETVLQFEGMPSKKRESLTAALQTFGFMIVFAALFRSLIGAQLLSVILAAATILNLILDLFQKNKDRLQSTVIVLSGVTVTLVSASYYNQYFGLLIMCIHPLIRVLAVRRREKTLSDRTRLRLEQLELNFNKQVEQEARKISRGMEDLVEEIEEKSMRDPLTKALNRSMIEKRVADIVTEPQTKLFSVALIDLDNFKKINDNLGHIAGDKCLLTLTEFLMKNKRRSDLVGRFGGDEFILIMPNLNAADALKAMEFHRKMIEEKSNPHFTVTIGIATYPYDGETLEELIRSADQSLYDAKNAGKNVVRYSGNYR